jgi:hypothetical protein
VRADAPTIHGVTNMADVERIAPPVPTLPPPVGRNIGSGRRQRPPAGPPTRRGPAEDDQSDNDKSGGNDQSGDQPPEHIDEYV